eukprot:4612960-Amphidinium_carterae.1
MGQPVDEPLHRLSSRMVQNDIHKQLKEEKPYVVHITMPELAEWPEPGHTSLLGFFASIITGTLEAGRHVILQMPLHSPIWNHPKFARCRQLQCQGRLGHVRM